MMIALFNNIPQLALGICWTWVCVWTGMRIQRWRSNSHLLNRK
jgi:hypothetical protein